MSEITIYQRRALEAADREDIETLSARMWNRFHNPRSPEDAILCGLIHQNCQRMLAGDESPELRRAMAVNLASLEHTGEAQ